jgi:hypothetical protein
MAELEMAGCCSATAQESCCDPAEKGQCCADGQTCDCQDSSEAR